MTSTSSSQENLWDDNLEDHENFDKRILQETPEVEAKLARHREVAGNADERGGARTAFISRRVGWQNLHQRPGRQDDASTKLRAPLVKRHADQGSVEASAVGRTAAADECTEGAIAVLSDIVKAAYRGPAMAEEECQDLTSDSSCIISSTNSSTNTT
eukprot:CAMPEP_0204222372 /NCGR_PEP_ID=MMETSP0361-20130328/82178_1 /ASSEMBLY_ACC=CAM_ASM_000343 /TAXON_ID=268821 /ORGANISM="Scrippsiella Hangoei, Strain SHTV-5" /LENGTH=156 /DNA_ID=CAMNT_0051187971 /DNA_START=195 /DNA_END=666 /DNA_ORIENTATION=-